MTNRTQVIVVGAGPVGSMLAGELRLGGAEVIVLERLAVPMTESRASTLHARTMEIFDSRGLLEKVGTPPNDVMGHFGGLPLDLTLASPYSGQWKVAQTRLEQILHEWAVTSGADLRRGHQVVGVTVGPNDVAVQAEGPNGIIEFAAQYVVACDGEDSTVRRIVGAAFPSNASEAHFERLLFRADIVGIEIPNRRFQRFPKGLAIAARRNDGVTRVMVHEFGRKTDSLRGPAEFNDVAEAWMSVTGENIRAGTPLWVDAFSDASRQLSHYRHGRILFAGDAAHQKMPTGGQALNLGLQDAFNLGWKLAACVRRSASSELLDSYHHERHPVGERVLSNIRAQATLLLGGPEVEPLRDVFGKLTKHDTVRAELASMIAGTDIKYDTAGRSPLLGARMPRAELVTASGTTSSTDLLRTGRGVLVVLSDDAQRELAPVAAPWVSRRIDMVPAKLAPEHPPLGTDAILIRPDGHVAWIRGDTSDLTTALCRWFGEPAHSMTKNRRNGFMGKLAAKSALVTGSSRGIGRATAIRLAREGALVAVHYTTNANAAYEVVTSIERDGGRAFAVQAELGVPGDVHQLFLGLEQGLKERTGSTTLHILVNNAGVMSGNTAPEKTTPEAFDRLMAVNAKAPFFIIQRALANMPEGGRIINISTGLTRFANPHEIAYAMSKGAVEMMALHFAKHLGPRNITINSVAPGITRNDNPVFDIPDVVNQMARLSTFNRVGEPADVADVVAFLASDDARWITGSFVDASGGSLLGG
ncbi:SDR family oxidoreductase [Pendulispora rubella]|uniref:SDR family oxidoreductase n=1 Tax=Pendulispora rubella TaxID=2741070 RepID=A0ABZ2L2G8_9BACT